jgi:preprotein translocase subunit SecE
MSGPAHPVLLREPPALTLRRSRSDFGSPWRARKFSRRAVAQLARVAVSKAAGWGFESLLPCKTHYRTNDEREGSKMTDAVEVTEEKLGIFARVGLFYRQVLSELKKVVWPTRNMLTTYTAVVLVFVTFVIAVVSVIDLVLTKVVFWVFG